MKRYIKTFILTLSICIFCLFLVILIPSKYIKRNSLLAVDYYNYYYDYMNSTLERAKDYRKKYDYNADMQTIQIIYRLDEKHPINSLIRAKTVDRNGTELKRVKEWLLTGEREIDYSRYWHGQIIFVKPLLIFFEIQTIYKIFLVVLVLLFLILFYKLYKEDKILAIIIGISFLVLDMFNNANCIEYYFMTVISVISSLIILKQYKNNSKNIGLLMVATGISANFFDFLSNETITFTLPLFIYSYLLLKNKKKDDFKNVFKYSIIWLISYALTAILRLLIAKLYIGGNISTPDNLSHLKSAFFLPYANPITMYTFILKRTISLIEIPHINIFILIGILIFIFSFKNKHEYLSLIYLSLIPFIRFMIIQYNCIFLFNMVYKAYLPFILFILLIYVKCIINILKHLFK